MLRTALGAVALVVLFTIPVIAGEVQGEFVKYDAEKKTIVLKIEEEEKEFLIDEEAVLFTLQGKPNKFGINGLSRFKTMRVFKLKTETKDDKEVVVELRPQP